MDILFMLWILALLLAWLYFTARNNRTRTPEWKRAKARAYRNDPQRLAAKNRAAWLWVMFG